MRHGPLSRHFAMKSGVCPGEEQVCMHAGNLNRVGEASAHAAAVP